MASGALLAIAGVWLLLQTIVGGLVGKILGLGKTTSTKAPTLPPAPGSTVNPGGTVNPPKGSGPVAINPGTGQIGTPGGTPGTPGFVPTGPGAGPGGIGSIISGR